MPTTQDLINAETPTLAALDLGTVYAFARVVIYEATNLKLAEFSMSFPAFPAPTDVATAANPIQQAIAASGGLPDHYQVIDRGGIVRLTGSIGQQGSGADLEMSALAPVSQGQNLALSDVMYTQLDVNTGHLTGLLALLSRPSVQPVQAPAVRSIEWIDLVRAAEGPMAFAHRDVRLEYEFGLGRNFYRRGSYTT